MVPNPDYSGRQPTKGGITALEGEQDRNNTVSVETCQVLSIVFV